MELPDTIDNFLKPLVFAQAVDENQLPANVLRQLDSIVSHFQNDAGNIVLFSGVSSSENAFAANFMGEQIGYEVYRIDLSAVASRYLGETEKHLLKVFEFAEKNNFILLFDEADSLFGKRTEVRSDDERYVNLDINYLLKRIATYPGLVIFTTDARDSLDETLLRAVPWQIDLHGKASRRHVPLWQRLFSR